VFKEYYEKLTQYKDANIQPDEIETKWKEDKSLESLKLLLVALAQQGEVHNYRKLEHILNAEKVQLKAFGHLALNFARLNLENQL